MQEFAYASDLVDVSMDTLTGSLTKNVKAMKQAGEGSKAYADAYDKLGVNVKDENGEFRNSEDVYWDVIDALGQMEEGVERDSIAMQILGKSAKDLNPLIKAGKETMAELAEEAHANGAVMSQEVLDTYNEFNDTLDRLSSRAGAAKNALGSILLPILQDIGGEGVDILGAFTNGVLNANGDLDKIADTVADTLSQVVQLAIEKLPTILNFGLKLFKAVFDGAIKSLPELIPQVISLAVELIDAIADELANGTLLEEIINVFVTLFSSLTQAIGEVLPVLAQKLPEIIGKIVEVLTNPDSIHAVLEGAVSLMLAVIQAIPVLITSLLQELPTIIDSILSVLQDKENWRIILEGAKSLLKAVCDAIPEILVSLAEALPQIITSLVEFFLDPENFAMVLSAVVELMGALLAAIPQICQKLGEKLPEILTAISEGLAPLGDFFAGIWEDLKTTFEGVGKWFGERFTEAWEAIKGAFASVGSFFEGIWNDITRIFTTVGTTIGNAVDSAFHNVLNTVIAWVEDAINGVIGWINGIIDGVNNVFGTDFGHISTVQWTDRGAGARADLVAPTQAAAATNGAAARWLQANAEAVASYNESVAESVSGAAALKGGSSAAGSTTSYTQNIYTPKAPTRAEIYNDTKNLLRLAGEGA